MTHQQYLITFYDDTTMVEYSASTQDVKNLLARIYPHRGIPKSIELRSAKRAIKAAIAKRTQCTNKTVLLTDTLEGSQSLEELWNTLSTLAAHIVDDNTKCRLVYPKDIRTIQIESIHTLLTTMKEIAK